MEARQPSSSFSRATTSSRLSLAFTRPLRLTRIGTPRGEIVLTCPIPPTKSSESASLHLLSRAIPEVRTRTRAVRCSFSAITIPRSVSHAHGNISVALKKLPPVLRSVKLFLLQPSARALYMRIVSRSYPLHAPRDEIIRLTADLSEMSPNEPKRGIELRDFYSLREERSSDR